MVNQYFLTYNAEKNYYAVWNNQKVICRVSNIRQSDENWLKVVEFLQDEYKRTQQQLEIYVVASASADLTSIVKAVEGIRKK